MNSLTNSGSFESVADAIVDTDLSDVGVEGAKLYLLSKDEAEALSADIRMLSSGDWALRTPANFNSCVYSVAPNGTVYECPVDNGFCVRPTLKLDLSKVDFTSDTDTFEIKSNFVSDIAAKPDLTYDGSKQDLITTGTAPDASVGMLQYSVKTASLITQNDNGYILLLSEEDVSSFKAGDLIIPANTNGIALPNGVKLKYGNNTYSYSEVEASELTDVFSWSASVPQGINAGNYPVYYRIIKDSTTVVEPTLIGTAVIGKADLTVKDANKPTAKTLNYDGEEKELVNAPATAPTGGTVKYKWNREDGTLYTNPTPPYVNLNDLKIGDIIHPINENGICLMQVESLVVKNASASNTYNHIVGNDYPYLYYYQSTDKLKLKISTDELYPQVVEWDYSEFDSFKVTAVNKTNSTLTVELHKYDPETSLNNWTADITKFTGTDAGEYKVEYKIEGDSNHKDSAVGSVDVTIGKGINGFAVPPVIVSNQKYKGSAIQLITSEGIPKFGDADKVKYLVTQSSEAPAADDEGWVDYDNIFELRVNAAGKYYVWYQIDAGTSWDAVEPTLLSAVNIERGKFFPSIYETQTWTMTMPSYAYDGTAHTPTINGEMFGDVTYTYYCADGTKLDEAPSDQGTYKVEVFASGGSLYYSRIRTATYSITEPSEASMFTVHVTNGNVNGKAYEKYVPNTVIAAIADAPAEGMKFGFWKRNGVTASYNTVYTFPVTENIKLEAVYLEADDEFNTTGSCVKDTVTIDKASRKITFSFMNTIPEDCTIVKSGLIATSDITKATDLSLENADITKEFTTTKHNFKYTWTKNNVADGQAWYVKGYQIYKDADGTEHTVYSEMEKATLNGSQTIHDDKIVGTSIMDSVNVDKANKKISFSALLNVPADCTITFAGVVATSDEEKVDELTNITETEKTMVDGIYVRGNQSKKHTVRYTWTKNNIGSETWYARSYLVYIDSLGTERVVFGDLVEQKLN